MRLAAAGESVIFFRIETDSEDMPALRVAAGIVTTLGGLTSDAAIVARSLGKPCIAGCSSLVVSYADETLSVRGGVTPGLGATRYYQTYYRNSAGSFCPPATFNITNGITIVW